jgi:UDP-2-acetamido-3-amino-2,3-dideoxy-glucuronate N-acetyltransferase
MVNSTARIHKTTIVEDGAQIGADARVWHFCHIRENVNIGPLTSLGKDVYVDKGVTIGKGSRIQNGVSIYSGVSVGDWCFIGPNLTFTNDIVPRAGRSTWKEIKTILEHGASIGAGAVLVCGIKIGAFSMVGAGAIVTSDVRSFSLVTGNPAQFSSLICACGDDRPSSRDQLILACCRNSLNEEVLQLAVRLAALG